MFWRALHILTDGRHVHKSIKKINTVLTVLQQISELQGDSGVWGAEDKRGKKTKGVPTSKGLRITTAHQLQPTLKSGLPSYPLNGNKCQGCCSFQRC